MHRPRPPVRLPKRKQGYSLLEVVMASTLAIATLVPAMELMRSGMQLGEKVDRQLLLGNYGARLLEQQAAYTTRHWTNGTAAGDWTTEGYPFLRYSLSRSDAVLAGGLVGRLMAITITTYIDTNDDDALTPGEASCVFRTKVGKFATYDAL